MPVNQSLLSSAYSFTKLEDNDIDSSLCLDHKITTCLPIIYSRPFTHSFQIILEENISNDEIIRTKYFAVPLNSCCIQLGSDIPLDKPMIYMFEAKKTLVQDETNIYTLNFQSGLGSFFNFTQFNSFINELNLDLCEINCGDVINFEIVQVIEEFNGLSWVPTSRNQMGITNCFKTICDEDGCYYSWIEYRCNEDSFNFNYQSANFLNRQALPMNLSRPQMTGEQKSYRKSDGVNLKISERLDEKWLLETDWMRYDWHKALKVALAHDYLTIRSVLALSIEAIDSRIQNDYTFIAETDYEIEWSEYTVSEAKGKCEVKRAKPFYLSNNNCA